MKRTISILCSIILLITVLLVSSFPAFAKGTDADSLSTLFDTALSVDGAYAESYALELREAFSEDPEVFITALSLKDECIIDNVTGLLVAEYYYSAGLEDLQTALSQVERIDTVYSAIEQHIQQQNEAKADHGEPPVFDEDDYGFDPDIIQGFIETNLLLGNDQDEEFNHTIAEAYQINPRLFAKTISDYAQEDITYLTQCIASDYKKTGAMPPNIDSVSAETAIAEIIDTIQAEISNVSDNKTKISETTSPETEPQTTPSGNSGYLFAIAIGVILIIAVCPVVVISRRRK